jgi:hypothetical protein
MAVHRAKVSRASRTRRKGRPSLKMKVSELAIKAGSVRSKSGPKLAIPIKFFKTLAGKASGVRSLLESYGRAFVESGQVGRAVGFRVEVDPRGASTITQVEPVHAVHAEVGTRPARHPALEDALAEARKRGRLRVTEILSGEDMLTADAFAELLGTTRMTINTKRQNRQVLALEGAKRGFRFPEWQVGRDGKPFKAIPDLFDRLGGDPWAVYRFLVQHHAELDGLTGCEALLRGKSKDVVEAAESVARAFG